MLAPSQLRATARLVAVLGLVGLCAGGGVAQSASPLRLAALAPAEQTLQDDPVRTGRGPFGLGAAHSGAISAKWRSLQPAIRVEARILALCRTDSRICSPGTSRFLAIIEAARARTGRARVGEVNRAVNLAIRPVSDLAQFHVPDVWTTPLMTFASGAGDCEDYAIAKYVALRESGMDADDLRLVIVHDRTVHEDHAVAAARVDGRWLILDNRHMMLLPDTQISNVTPLLALDSENDGLSRDAAAIPRKMFSSEWIMTKLRQVLLAEAKGLAAA